MRNFLVIASLVVLLSVVQAQVPYFGRCPLVRVVDTFDASSYMGLWFEQERYPTIFQIGGKCTRATYALLPNGTVSVFNQQQWILTGRENSISGTAELVAPGQLAVNFPNSPPTTEANYLVLATDYTSYAVVYSCSPISRLFNARFVWLLTRDQIVSDELLQKAYSVLDANRISRGPLSRTDQVNCSL